MSRRLAPAVAEAVALGVARMVALGIALGVALGSAGCVAPRKAMWNPPEPSFGGVSDDVVAGLLRDGDGHWQKREDPAELDEAARAYGTALRYHPSDPGILVRLGRVAFRRGTALRHKDALDLAVQYAERALTARNPDLGVAARAGHPADAVFNLAEQADAPALVLYAEALLAWSLSHGTPTVLAHRDAVRAAAGNALRFDRAVGWAAPDRVLGILACELPEARQNLAEARDHFEAAAAAAPAYLPTRLAFAEEYAARVRDRPLYERLLREVVDADAQALPDAQPENADAQRAARALLQKPQ